jgi:hypothetical protein
MKKENKMLGELNDFMKKYGVKEIDFGSHGLKKTKGKKAKPVKYKK